MPLLTFRPKNAAARIQISDLPDVSGALIQEALQCGRIAVDTETSGLDWRTERIGSCQIYSGGTLVEIVRCKSNVCPDNLRKLLSDESVQKVFHHAMFDMRFLAYGWNARVNNAACTKIASKLLAPGAERDHSLKTLLRERLEIQISKSPRFTDWFADRLTDRQKIYAASDVLYLGRLLDSLEEELATKDLLRLTHKCFQHLPTRVQLDLFGYRDVYEY